MLLQLSIHNYLLVMSHSFPKKIFWIIPSLNLNQATVRLRCLHIARALKNNFNYDNYYFTEINEAKSMIEPGSYVFIIKMPSVSMINVLVKAKSLNCKIIIDIPDAVCDIHYKNNDYGINGWILNSLIDLTNAIFVPTPKMRNHLLKHANSSKLRSWEKKVYILPDIAETMQDSLNLCEHMVEELKDKNASYTIKKIKSLNIHTEKKVKVKRVLWFGNGYSPTSNMGISSLIPLLPVLKKLQDKHPFVLVVCTNANSDFRIFDTFKVKYEAIEWSIPEIFNQIALASMSLITTGDDERCQGKSNNRVLFSLINNCPACVIKHPNNSEFDMTIERSLESGISRFIFSKNSQIERINALNENSFILKRYTLNEVVKLYNLTLQNINFEVLSSRDQNIKLANEESIVSIICDDLSLDDLRKICSLLNKEVPSCHINYIHFSPISENYIKHYASNNTIPYLLRIDDINKSKNLMLNNICLIASDQLNASIYDQLVKFGESHNRFAKSTNALAVAIINQSSLKSFLYEQNINIRIEECDSGNRLPENIPGRNQPSNINTSEIDVLFVCGIETKNWILDGIAKEIGSRSIKSWSIYYCDKKPERLPKANNYFFMHQALLKKFVKLKLVDICNCKNVNCWYTHPRDEDKKTIDDFLNIFSKINKIIFACSDNYNLWISRGLAPKKGCVVLGGFDSARFIAHDRELSNDIGVCSSFYERKNPELLFQLVSKMRDKKFILLGKNWESYARYEALVGLGNLEYVTVKYEDYPAYYNKFKIFLSTSRLEGGPIPLMEAMACNCFPVVSKTGFAKDVINHGSNGFLFDTLSTAETVSELIEKAYTMNDIDIASTVGNYSWDHFSKNVCRAIEK